MLYGVCTLQDNLESEEVRLYLLEHMESKNF